MRIALVVTYNAPNPEVLPDMIKQIDPPHLKYFDGELRVVVGTDVDDLVRFLEEEE